MTTILTAPFEATITEPGVYDIPVDEYHRDPVVGGSLSSSGARMLLPPSCPAKFRYEQDHPGETSKRHFDIGNAAHKLVLGAGAELVVIDAANYKTKSAQDQQRAAHAAGAVPLLPHEYEQVQAMAAAIRGHEIAGPLLEPGSGWAELTLVWKDKHTGIWCRARLDWVRGGERTVIVDVKTTRAGDLDSISRFVADHGYHVQEAWYRAGAEALGLADRDTVFVFVFVEKDPPYLVTPVYLDPTALRIGTAKCVQALSIYQHCVTENHWYGHTDDLALVSLPPWVERNEGER